MTGDEIPPHPKRNDERRLQASNENVSLMHVAGGSETSGFFVYLGAEISSLSAQAEDIANLLVRF